MKALIFYLKIFTIYLALTLSSSLAANEEKLDSIIDQIQIINKDLKTLEKVKIS